MTAKPARFADPSKDVDGRILRTDPVDRPVLGGVGRASAVRVELVGT